MKPISFTLLLLLTMISCTKEPEIQDSYLDGPVLFDASLYQPDSFLLSSRTPLPTDLNKPVIIAGHGYSASTFEWEEFQEFIDNTGSNVLLSRVLLGGHGRTYEDFRSSSWRDWQSALLEEYQLLKAQGYQNISFAGSSTGCPLLLELIAGGDFKEESINHFFLIDPIIIPSSKILSLAPIVGPMLGYIEVDQSPEEDQYWYHFRPQETLQELDALINLVRQELQAGIQLPGSAKMKVYKALRDNAADPASAVLIQKGISPSNQFEVDMIDTDHHVFTRLKLRENVSDADVENQTNVFNEMVNKVQN